MKKRIVLIAAILYMFFPGAATHAFQSGDVSIHGFISQGYLLSDKNNYLADTEDGTFEFNEMGINFSTDVAKNLRIGLQLFARDLGDVGNDEITVPWAFADYGWKEWLGLRVGFMKPAYGFYGETWDVDPLRPSILLPQSIYDEAARDAESTIKGIGIYGNILLGGAGILNYQAQYGVFQAGSGVWKKFENMIGTQIDTLTITDSSVGKLQWTTPLDGLRVAYSHVKTSLDITASGMIQRIKVSSLEFNVFSIEYTIGNFLIGGEGGRLNYMGAHATVLNPITNQIMDVSRSTKTGDMGYVNLAYRFTDWFQLAGYYSMLESNKDYESPSDPDDDLNTLNDLCLTLRFDINENWIVKVEGHNMDGALSSVVTKGEDETEADDKWNLYAVKVSYNF